MELRSKSRYENLAQYSSPLRVLAQTFKSSRDGWKRKYQELQHRMKEYRTALRDVRRSREQWRGKAQALQQQLKQLQEQPAEEPVNPPVLS